ncbi:VCBS repeat-containing protein [Flavivirga algicola]|uniref:VCBS repeat-containing protein n=1 Tax=Flavivirga algicola TaxID=2729136 RepID=A0ABX1S2T1_9FLAO|nr:VCBS repeat-containing protein [Flavivirga algicola]NMH89691.1 VCBS repeat-containing protein [Flavivirga algicola]
MTKMKPQLVTILILVLIMACQGPQRDLYPETLTGHLQLLSSERTGIDFNNTIKETTTKNIFYYSQIYNGAGVAIGDINNDNLPDIFFCGNEVSDRLYLNKGQFQFEDITKKSRIAKHSGWSWGVTMVDINADGYLDIYISRNGESMKLEDRKNQLYINNQDLTFTESAMAYGLADAGFSTQAVFFDMDNDGDLDMYQVNQPADSKLFKRFKIPEARYKFYTDKLYRNDNGRYRDVSQQAGIQNTLAYGLSVNASDFNNDGWTDLYIANDYDEPDFMYYNNGDGTFRDVVDDKLKHVSRFSMGSDTGDINNDGLIDLMTLDMAAEDHYRSKTNMGSMSTEAFNKIVNTGGHYQYMFNTLQINTGAGSFSDVANIAGIAKTDWSWGTLLVDLDNDGWKDIVVSNGIKKDVRNNDFVDILNNLDINMTAEEFFGKSKLAPSSPLPNYVFKNRGGLEFEKVTKDWGFDAPSFSSGIAYGDLDNDGDLDIVTNNMDAPAFVYENKATGNFLTIDLEGPENNTQGYGAKATIYHNGKIQVAEHHVTRGYFSSVEPGLFFGLGKDVEIDKVEVVWADGKRNLFENIGANRTIMAKYSKAEKTMTKGSDKTKKPFVRINAKGIGLPFVHKENEFDDFEKEVLLPHKLSQNGPFSASGDVNGDGLEDLFIGGAIGESGILYIQQKKNGTFKKNVSQPWEKDKDSEDLGCLFMDIDGDGDKDLFIASGGSEFERGHALLKDRIYINNGLGEFTKSDKALPAIYESSQCVKVSDIDSDGDLDIFVGTRLIADKYPFPASSYLLVNEGGVFEKASDGIAPSLENIGMVTDAVFTDIDGDNDDDLMLVGEWMEIVVLENEKGKFINNSEKYGLNDTRGLWWSITASDLDNDGDDDYIIGNLGKNNKFKASKEHPFKVYANDFDNNGINDVVLAKYYKNDYVPVRGRECTSQQMPYVAEKFKDYHSFASSKLLEILPEDKVENAVIYEISNFESIVLINDAGMLKRKQLPIQAQISPIKSSVVSDFNHDGFKDILIAGNHYGVEVETTRYDAGIGAVLLGDGKNNFTYLPPKQSGFYVPYDSRDITCIRQSNKNLIVITNNNGPVTIFSNRN